MIEPREIFVGLAVALVASLITPPATTFAQSTTTLPPGVKTVRVNGYDMAYVENGSGRPLIMVHGAMSDYRMWATQMEPLGQRHRAVAVSLRHYFPERWDGKGGTFSWQQHVADLRSFVGTLDAGPVDLVAHSRGGIVAVQLALAEPSLIRSLILAEPFLRLTESGGFGVKLQENSVARIKSAVGRLIEGDIEGGLEIYADATGGPGSWKARPEAERQIPRDNVWTLKGMEEEQRPAVSCRELEGLNIPVLLVGGEKSSARNGEILNVIEPCLKKRARVTISNASHAMNRMNPAAFNKAVLQFLSSH